MLSRETISENQFNFAWIRCLLSKLRCLRDMPGSEQKHECFKFSVIHVQDQHSENPCEDMTLPRDQV